MKSLSVRLATLATLATGASAAIQLTPGEQELANKYCVHWDDSGCVDTLKKCKTDIHSSEASFGTHMCLKKKTAKLPCLGYLHEQTFVQQDICARNLKKCLGKQPITDEDTGDQKKALWLCMTSTEISNEAIRAAAGEREIRKEIGRQCMKLEEGCDVEKACPNLDIRLKCVRDKKKEHCIKDDCVNYLQTCLVNGQIDDGCMGGMNWNLQREKESSQTNYQRTHPTIFGVEMHDLLFEQARNLAKDHCITWHKPGCKQVAEECLKSNGPTQCVMDKKCNWGSSNFDTISQTRTCLKTLDRCWPSHLTQDDAGENILQECMMGPESRLKAEEDVIAEQKLDYRARHCLSTAQDFFGVIQRCGRSLDRWGCMDVHNGTQCVQDDLSPCAQAIDTCWDLRYSNETAFNVCWDKTQLSIINERKELAAKQKNATEMLENWKEELNFRALFCIDLKDPICKKAHDECPNQSNRYACIHEKTGIDSCVKDQHDPCSQAINQCWHLAGEEFVFDNCLARTEYQFDNKGEVETNDIDAQLLAIEEIIFLVGNALQEWGTIYKDYFEANIKSMPQVEPQST